MRQYLQYLLEGVKPWGRGREYTVEVLTQSGKVEVGKEDFLEEVGLELGPKSQMSFQILTLF